NRKQITVNWLICDETFEIGKAARLISKMVSIFKVGEAENPKWIQFTRNTAIPDLELIRLNLDTLQLYTTPNHPEVIDYYDSYETINNWEVLQFAETQKHYRELFGKKLGKRPEDIDLRRDARIPMDGKSTTLPGSKSIFVPLAVGANPVDKRGLNLKALAVLAKDEGDEEDEGEEQDENDNDTDEGEADEENADVEDVVTFNDGDLVQTEFGFGYIRAAYEGGKWATKVGVRVVIPGFNLRNNQPYPITFSRLSVFKPVPPSDDESSAEYRAWLRNVNILKNDMKKAGKKGITFVSGYIEPSTTRVPLDEEEKLSTIRPPKQLPPHPAAKPQPKIKVIRDEEPEEEEQEESRVKQPHKIIEHIPRTPKQRDKAAPMFDFDMAIINGIPALTVYTNEEGEHLEALHDHGTWYPVQKFMNAHVQTYQGAQNLVNKIKEVFPATSENLLASIMAIAKKIRGQTTNDLRVRRQAVQFNDIKNFMKVNHIKTTSQQVIKLYPYLLNDEMFVAADINIQPKQTSKLRGLNIRGVSRFQIADPMAWHFGKDVSTLKRYLKKLRDAGIKINGYEDTMAKLDDPFYHKLSGYEALR
ncbi:MAG TPA: hypothetical protein VNX68_09465, partial [Nitrosopumilaceae archaeon]|nr:hypothetical protein [Nitrosopumilaceae archaeon]